MCKLETVEQRKAKLFEIEQQLIDMNYALKNDNVYPFPTEDEVPNKLCGTRIVKNDFLYNAAKAQREKRINGKGKVGNFTLLVKTNYGNFMEYSKSQRESYNLSLPAVREGIDKGILNDSNYQEIKKGGFIVLEKYSIPPIGVQKIYDSLKEDSGEVVYNIIDPGIDYKALAASKLRQFEENEKALRREAKKGLIKVKEGDTRSLEEILATV